MSSNSNKQGIKVKIESRLSDAERDAVIRTALAKLPSLKKADRSHLMGFVDAVQEALERSGKIVSESSPSEVDELRRYAVNSAGVPNETAAGDLVRLSDVRLMQSKLKSEEKALSEIISAAATDPATEILSIIGFDASAGTFAKVQQVVGRAILRGLNFSWPEAKDAARTEPNGGMHDSIFVKIWGEHGGSVGRIALADYSFKLGAQSVSSLYGKFVEGSSILRRHAIWLESLGWSKQAEVISAIAEAAPYSQRDAENAYRDLAI